MDGFYTIRLERPHKKMEGERGMAIVRTSPHHNTVTCSREGINEGPAHRFTCSSEQKKKPQSLKDNESIGKVSCFT